MLLPDLITYIIVKDNNQKECLVVRNKALSVKANIRRKISSKNVQEKNLSIRRKININFIVPIDLTPSSRTRKLALFVEG